VFPYGATCGCFKKWSLKPINYIHTISTPSLYRALKAALCFASASVPNISPWMSSTLPSTWIETVDWNIWGKRDFSETFVILYCGLCSWSPWIFSQYSCRTFIGVFLAENLKSNCSFKAACSSALFAASSSASFFLAWCALTKCTVCPCALYSMVHWWVIWLDVDWQLKSFRGFSPLSWHHSLNFCRQFKAGAVVPSCGEPESNGGTSNSPRTRT